MFSDTAMNFIEYLKQAGFISSGRNFTIKLENYPMAESLVKNIEVYNNFLQDRLPRYCIIESKRIAISEIVVGCPSSMSFNLTIFINEGTSAKNIFFTKANLSEISYVISDEVFEIMLNIIKEDLEEIVKQNKKILTTSGFGEF